MRQPLPACARLVDSREGGRTGGEDMPERPWSMLLIVAWGYVLLCCALVPVVVAAFWVYHPAVISEKLLGYFGSDNQSDKTAQFELVKLYVQAAITFLTTLFFAAGAYIIVTHSQKTGATLQLAMAKLKLISELDAEIRGVFNKPAIYDPADGKTLDKPRNFVFGLDRRTTWKANCRREWHHHFGERTTPFVETSTTLATDSEVSINVLHDYVAWVRRVRLGVDFGILDWPDVQLYWRDFVSLAGGARFSFMCDVFSREDMSDFAFLMSGLILFENKDGRENLLRYIDRSTHRAMLDALSPKARAIVAPPVSGRRKAQAPPVQIS